MPHLQDVYGMFLPFAYRLSTSIQEHPKEADDPEGNLEGNLIHRTQETIHGATTEGGKSLLDCPKKLLQ